jgi:hypothetical protein
VGAFFAVANLNAAELSWSVPGSVRERDLLPRPQMNVGMEVLVDGVSARTIPFGGKVFLPVSRYGTEYEIRVWNHGPRRIAAIVSVDGLSVINGRPASASSPGYVIDPHSSIWIKGWRRDLDTVAAFTFENRENSYAARMGHSENIGVIGLLAIEEAVRPHPMPMEWADSARGALKSSSEIGGTGTGYGREIGSSVIYVPFARSANTRTVTYYYDTVAALRRIGVPVDSGYPEPFPGPGDFVPPPPRLR